MLHLDDGVAVVVEQPEPGIADIQQRVQALAPARRTGAIAKLAGEPQHRLRGRAQAARRGEHGRAGADLRADQANAVDAAQRGRLASQRVDSRQRLRAQFGVQQPHRRRQRAAAQALRVGAQVGEAVRILLHREQRQRGSRGVQVCQHRAMAGTGHERDVAVVERGAERGRETLEQALLAPQRGQRVAGRQAQQRGAGVEDLVVGVRRRRRVAARALAVRGRGLRQQLLDAVGHRRPREPARLPAAALQQRAAHFGALHGLEPFEGLGQLVRAEIDVQRRVAAHLGQRGRARGDRGALTRHGLQHGQSEAFVARRIDQRHRARIGAAQVQVVQQHHVHVGVACQRTALRIKLATAGADDRVIPALVAEQRERCEEQRRVLVAGARTRGHEVRARDVMAALEVGHLFGGRRHEVATRVVHLHLYRAAGEALEIARGAFRDGGKAFGVAECQRLLLPHRVVHVRTEHLGDHVVDHAHRRRGERVAVVRGDEQRGAHRVAHLLDDAAVALDVGVVHCGRVVVADARHARRGARAVDDDQAAPELGRRPQPQQRGPHAGDARAAELEEDTVDDDGRRCAGFVMGSRLQGHDQAALRLAAAFVGAAAKTGATSCTDTVAARHMLRMTSSTSVRAAQPRRCSASAGSAAP